MQLPFEEIHSLVTQQLTLMRSIANSFPIKLNHVKPHGALYNISARDQHIAKAVATAISDFDEKLTLFGLSGSHSINEARALGLKTASEVFADRTYQDDGSLTPRSQANALIEESSKSIQQVMQMITASTVTTVTGKQVPIKAETICIHGDGVHAVEFAKTIYAHLKQNNVDIKAI
jgi:UPF0271 protein